MAHHGGPHAQVLDGDQVARLGQHADHHRLAVQGGLDLDAQVVGDAAGGQLRTPPLGQALFGNIHVGADLDDIDQPPGFTRGGGVVGDVMKVAIHPQADAGVVFVLLDVQVTGTLADRLQQQGIAQGNEVGLDAVVARGQQVAVVRFRRFLLPVQFAPTMLHLALQGKFQGGPQALEVVGCDQDLGDLLVGMHVVDIGHRTVGVIGGDQQAIVFHTQGNEAVTVQEAAGEALHQVGLYLVQQLVGAGKAHPVCLRQTLVKYCIF